jgi:hypothetical protein
VELEGLVMRIKEKDPSMWMKRNIGTGMGQTSLFNGFGDFRFDNHGSTVLFLMIRWISEQGDITRCQTFVESECASGGGETT